MGYKNIQAFQPMTAKATPAPLVRKPKRCELSIIGLLLTINFDIFPVVNNNNCRHTFPIFFFQVERHFYGLFRKFITFYPQYELSSETVISLNSQFQMLTVLYHFPFLKMQTSILKTIKVCINQCYQNNRVTLDIGNILDPINTQPIR